MTTPSVPPTASSTTGLAPNVAGALAYVLGPITGVIFLVLEKNSAFVRFHAMQSLVVGVAWIAGSIVLSVLETVLAVIPVLGWILGLVIALVVGLGGLVLWVMLILRALQGKEWEVPLAGAYARRFASTPAAI